MNVSRREFSYVAGAAGTGTALFFILPKVFGSDETGDSGAMVGVFPSVRVATL